ncbi:MAG TPA: sulfite exporter TauE/SafE family protein [Phenylobacterium sp.]
MSGFVLAFVLAATAITAAISGVFGMAGGSLLMGALMLSVPVATAMVLHGAAQLVSNCARAVLHWRHIRFPIVAVFGAGSILAMGLMSFVSYTPSKALVFLAMGLLPILVWIPQRWSPFEIAKPTHAFFAGVSTTALALTSGVSGPLTELFLVRSMMPPRQVIATKASLQVFGHVAKIVFYGGALLDGAGDGAVPPWLLIAVGLSALAGAAVGGRLLDRLSEENFRRWRKWIFTAISATFLIQAAQLYLSGQS